MLDVVALNTPTAPLTAAQLREWLRLNDTAEDGTLTDLIAGALEVWEQKTACPIIHTQYRQFVEKWPSEVVFARGNFFSFAGVWWRDDNGDDQEHDGWSVATTTPARLLLRSQPPTPAELQQPAGFVEYTAGLAATANAAPKQAILAIKLLAAHWYENREAFKDSAFEMREVPEGFSAIATRYKLGLSGRWGQ